MKTKLICIIAAILMIAPITLAQNDVTYLHHARNGDPTMYEEWNLVENSKGELELYIYTLQCLGGFYFDCSRSICTWPFDTERCHCVE